MPAEIDHWSDTICDAITTAFEEHAHNILQMQSNALKVFPTAITSKNAHHRMLFVALNIQAKPPLATQYTDAYFYSPHHAKVFSDRFDEYLRAKLDMPGSVHLHQNAYSKNPKLPLPGFVSPFDDVLLSSTDVNRVVLGNGECVESCLVSLCMQEEVFKTIGLAQLELLPGVEGEGDLSLVRGTYARERWQSISHPWKRLVAVVLGLARKIDPFASVGSVAVVKEELKSRDGFSVVPVLSVDIKCDACPVCVVATGHRNVPLSMQVCLMTGTAFLTCKKKKAEKVHDVRVAFELQKEDLVVDAHYKGGFESFLKLFPPTNYKMHDRAIQVPYIYKYDKLVDGKYYDVRRVEYDEVNMCFAPAVDEVPSTSSNHDDGDNGEDQVDEQRPHKARKLEYPAAFL